VPPKQDVSGKTLRPFVVSVKKLQTGLYSD
jgi:hypothetical protein